MYKLSKLNLRSNHVYFEAIERSSLSIADAENALCAFESSVATIHYGCLNKFSIWFLYRFSYLFIEKLIMKVCAKTDRSEPM